MGDGIYDHLIMKKVFILLVPQIHQITRKNTQAL